MDYGGFYVDSHSGPMPDQVRELLNYTLPRCPNLGGVTFEILGSWFVEMGDERLAKELTGMKNLWHRHQPAPEKLCA